VVQQVSQVEALAQGLRLLRSRADQNDPILGIDYLVQQDCG